MLAERNREPARHGPVPISLLFPAFGQHLERRSWGLLGMAKISSPSPPFLNRTHSLQMLKGIKWKGNPPAIGYMQKLALTLNMGILEYVSFERLDYDPGLLTNALRDSLSWWDSRGHSGAPRDVFLRLSLLTAHSWCPLQKLLARPRLPRPRYCLTWGSETWPPCSTVTIPISELLWDRNCIT